MVDDPEFSIRVESKDGDRVSPWVVVCAGVTVRGVDQGEGGAAFGEGIKASAAANLAPCKNPIFRNDRKV